MDRFASLVARTSMVLASISFAGFLVTVIAQVAYRYLDISIVFSEDAARLFNIYAVFLGLVMVVHAHGDVRIDLIDRYVGENRMGRRILRLLYTFTQLSFLSAISYGSFLLMKSNWGWALPAISFLHQGYIYLAPFLGSTLSIVVIILRALSDFSSERSETLGNRQ